MVGVKTKMQVRSISASGAGIWSENISGIRILEGTLTQVLGTEFEVGQKRNEKSIYKFACDYIKGLDFSAEDRLVKGNRTFEILDVNNVANANRYWIILLKEIV